MKKIYFIAFVSVFCFCFFSNFYLTNNSHFSEIKSINSKDSLLLQIKLGRMLFYEKQLSRDSSISCGSCHIQSLAFADSMQFSNGIKKRKPARNTPTLTNIGMNSRFMFDGFLNTLEKQIIVPVEEHNEMDFSLLEASKRLNKNKKYKKMAYQIFRKNIDPFVITRSIAAFERTMLSSNSKYDQYKKGKIQFNVDEKEGMNLFFNVLKCNNCHSGENFSNDLTFNNGLTEEYSDVGRFRVTLLEEDKGKFKVPTLRNIALTKPYMHDGSITDLISVIKHYESGGKNHINKSPMIQSFELNSLQEKQLIQFLETLTDNQFIMNKNLSPLKR